MLRTLKTTNVGPAPKMRFDFGDRLNVLTGDNGVGKSFVLDLVWFVLTRGWSGRPARPSTAEPADIVGFLEDTGSAEPAMRRWNYVAEEVDWSVDRDAELHDDALVIYARIDGGFSIADPLRGVSAFDFPRGRVLYTNDVHLDAQEVWDGKDADEPSRKTICEGLLRDWEKWRGRGSEEFVTITRVLEIISPSTGEQIRPGDRSVRLSPDDARDIPTLHLPYGEVPLLLASAGMRHVLAIAYALVWTWSEHRKLAELKQVEPRRRLTLLLDEVEAHLHPQWQRVIVPSLLRAVTELSPKLEVQVYASTHAPLVMASLEPHFEPRTDRVFNLRLTGQRVRVEPVPWAPQGDAVGWLVSEVFGLQHARSREAEITIEAAEAFMRGAVEDLPANLATKEAIHRDLVRLLPGHDPFWPRWIVALDTPSAVGATE
jgi:hypothetical protein